jgi:hypothetical protein
MTGLASLGTTWDDNNPPSPTKNYHVVGGHTVTLDGAFAGATLKVENGTLDINAAASGQAFGQLTIETGGNLTESVAGDISIGNGTSSSLRLNRDVALNLDANSSLRVKATLTGAGALNLNAATPGSAANAQVYLDATNTHTGVVRFNAGKQVNITESAAPANLEMNSTEAGGNILWWETKASVNAGSVTFNQPGTFVHAVGLTTPVTANIRLQGPATLIANAAVTVDLSNTFSREERRYLTGTNGLQGAGDILVKGTPTDPTSASSAENTTGITLNEFEVGAQGTDPGISAFDTYSGTISTQDYVNVEIRRSLPRAKIVINQNARMDTGAQAVPLPVGNGTTIGEVAVNSGGILEVGFEQANANGGFFIEGHHANHLKLTQGGGRSGGLTMAAGSTLRMQLNGLDQTAYDWIQAQGNVNLSGTLNVLINPSSCTGNDPCDANVNPAFSPQLGDTFDIIRIGAASGDYDGNGTVGPEDYDLWRSTFGNAVSLGSAADGNANGVIDAGDYVIWRNTPSATKGVISGTFQNLSITDPIGYLTGATLQVIYSPTLVQLKVVAAPVPAAGVPEPTVGVLCGIAALLIGTKRRR